MFIAGCLLACAPACDTQSDCPSGHEQCECTPDYSCLEGLQCLSNRCVEDGSSDATPTSGSPSDSAVEACNSFVTSLDCPLPEGPPLIDCSIYGEVDCDVAPYFDCLTENTQCEPDEPIDASGWTECAELLPTQGDCT